MDSGETYLTQAGYDKLAEEIERLRTVRRREIAREIEKARAYGDISENAEYDAAKDAQAHNEQRIAELEAKLSKCRILDDSLMSKDEVLIGATVKLRDMDTGEEFEYMLVAEVEADYAQNKISVSSPVGKALLGHKAAEIVEIVIPAGILKYRIESISR